MIKVNKVSKNEFILALAIITFCITLHTMLHPPVIETTMKVKITPIYNVSTTINKEGNVKVYVK